jgi:RNA polymerase sigma-70 factor (ECF subfamily)
MFSVSLHDKNKAPNYTDEEILEHIKTGNEELFEHIYNKRNKKIYSYVMTILNYNPDDANEIVGDVFIWLYEYNKEHLINSCKNFLYTSAHNKSIDLIRKKSEVYTHDTLQDQITDPENEKQKTNINLTYQQQLMQKYLEQLQPKEREIIHLFYYEGKSYEEIAGYLWSNKNTIWTMILQAKKKIKEFVEREGTQKILSE